MTKPKKAKYSIDPGVYRFNSIFDPTRCIDLDTQIKGCTKQTQKMVVNQYWNFTHSPQDGFWDIRWAGNADCFLYPDFEYLDIVANSENGGLPAPAWEVHKICEGQFAISANGLAIDYWSSDGNSGRIRVAEPNGSAEQLWGLQLIGPLPGKSPFEARFEALEKRVKELEDQLRKVKN